MMVAANERPRLEDRVPAIVYGALIIFLLSSAILVRMSTAIQIGYAVCAAVALGLPLLLFAGATPPDRRVRNGALLAAAGSCLFLIPAAILPEGRQLLQVLVDFCTTLLPIGFLVTGLAVPATFRRLLDRRWVVAFGLTALWAPLVIQTPEYARVFEPPDVSVIALVTTVAISSRNEWGRAGAAAGVLGLTGLAGLSGSRSVFLLALLAFAVAVLRNRTARWLAAASLVAALLISLVNLDAVRSEWNADTVSPDVPRSLTLFRAGRGDVSTTNRRWEIGVVFEEMGRRNPAWIITGAGHGAVIAPEEWRSPRTISADGFVHNVHFGPQLMLFRYGIVGVALYLLILLHAATVLIRCLRERGPPEPEDPQLLFALGTTLFLLEFMFRNVLPNPLFSFFVAGHIALTLQSTAAYKSRKRVQTAG